MNKAFGQGDPSLSRYAIETFHPLDEALEEIQKRTEKNGLPPIHVGPMDGLHLEILTRASQARLAVEIGTLAGYSGLCIARALPKNGHLYTFEMDEKHAKTALETFQLHGVQNQVTLLQGKASDLLPEIENKGPFDLVFIDADKTGYPSYLDWAAKNLRIGGIVIADNTFAWGLVIDPKPKNEDRPAAEGIREFNRKLANDPRFRATLLPTAEGLSVGVKIRE